jgi:hydroxyethylthiazole kinase-like uncharacterized protein yjeF
MRDIDRRAIETRGIPGIALMEAAGIALANACREELGGTVAGRRIAIFCGPGNNGGDGFVAARHLAADDARVTVLHTAALTDLQGDAALAAVPLKNSSSLRRIELGGKPTLTQRYDLIIDALLGTGSRLPLTGGYPDLVAAINDLAKASECPVIACDLPTGIDADSGKADGPAIRATRTVTFALPKPGLLLFPGAEFVGRITVANIGIPRDLYADLPAFLTTQDELRTLLPPRAESRDANKGAFGTLLVIAGSAGMAGASALSALSGLRAGAGLVMLALPESLIDVASVLAPEAVLRHLPETAARTHGGPGALDAALALAEKADAVAMGPGMGQNDDVARFIQEFARRVSKPLLVDADGLNALARTPDALRARTAPTALTPHPGEMGRLMNCATVDVQADRIGTVRAAAERYGVTVLLKGSRTLIAEPGGRWAINRRGTAALATAGSGDVLTGVIGAYLGQGLSAFDAARAGAYVHALAGEAAAESLGNIGVLAGDVRDHLPIARRRLYEPMKLDDL